MGTNKETAALSRIETLCATNNYTEAIFLMEQVLETNDLPEFRTDYGMMLLTVGRYLEGFRNYEYRLRCREFRKANHFPYQPPGVAPLEVTEVVVAAEQGLGDTIQFMRYIPYLWNSAYVFCPEELVPIVSRMSSVIRATSDETSLPPWVTVFPLLSLPLIARATLDNIPNTGAYITASKQGPLIPGKLSIGLCHKGRHGVLETQGRDRTMPYELLWGTTWAGGRRFNFIDLSLQRESVDVLTNIINELDLIITVDTLVAHLAGALAKPTWLMLPYNPEWRWMLDREDSPWYPTMRLFRQSKPGDWEGVVNRIVMELAKINSKEDIDQTLSKGAKNGTGCGT